MKNELPKGFKMTEIGPLPKEWGLETLGNLNSARKATIDPARFAEEVFEYYSIPAYQQGARPVQAKGTEIGSSKLLLNQSGILFGKLNPRVEKVWIVGRNVGYRQIGSTEWLPLVPDEKRAHVAYVYFALWSDYVMPVAKGLVTGSTPSRQRVDPASFYAIRIPLPPLPEQKKIAAVLSAVQEAKEKTEAVIRAAKELKKSLMKHLFTYGLVPVEETEKVPLRETEVGEIPEEWEVAKIGDLACVRGGYGFPHRYQGRLKGEYPFYKVSDMNLPGNEVRMAQANNYVDDATIGQLRAKPFAGNTIIFPKIGAAVHTNKKRILTKASLIDNNVMGVSVLSTERCDPMFLLACFGMLDLRDLSNPGPLPSITAQRVKNTKVPLPPFVEQKRIAETVSGLDEKIAATEDRKKSLEELFKTLLNDLMTARLRVKDLEVAV